MAFPTINAQQELNNRKILEDLQHKKQLILQKGVSPVAGIPVNNANQITNSMPLLMQVNSQPTIGISPQQPQQSPSHDLLSPGSNLGRAAWVQANSQSFGFFVAQDSMFGNNILPVLPRPQPNPPK
ncbi:SOSS complex subunit C homolog isoform X1 [Contarinia nasturtii]|uniref:SOSS complex subunit C homolog isoform X1 n=1 Tax=Contarinia nasturtii TaxID=265458 RepID=UPI0012D3FA7B|nr:SOSS complex subunit C homolog isoform X1 [Contarinia nasturtii]